MTEFVVTTTDGKQFRGSSENARLSSLVDHLSSKGYCELDVQSRGPGAAGPAINTVFFKHGIISISEGRPTMADMPVAASPVVG